MSEDCAVIVPSELVTLASSAVVAVLVDVATSVDSFSSKSSPPSVVTTPSDSSCILRRSVNVASSVVMSLALDVIEPSAVVTRVVSADNPEALAATPVVPLFTVDSSAVMSEACEVIEPSAVVTLVSSPDIADAFAATPVEPLFTVVSNAVMSELLVVMLPSAVVTLVVNAVSAEALVVMSPSADVMSD